MENIHAITASKIFTGKEMLHDHGILFHENKVQQVLPINNIPSSVETQFFNEGIIAPAFIDIQIYGAYNKLLAIYPESDAVKNIYEYSKAGGAAWCMPTVATNTYDVFYKGIDAVRKYWEDGRKGVLGLHIEGPWLNKNKKGAHNEAWIHAPEKETVLELLAYGKGVIKIITLAPEICSNEIIELIQMHDVVVSAGHSDASYKQATDAFNTNIYTATHLFNAMSPLNHRAPGMAGAIMDHPSVLCSVVPDGHHVDFAAIRIAKSIMKERIFAITDAVTESEDEVYSHHFEGDKYTCNGILSGSALTMHKAFLNFVHHCNIDVEEALRMCSYYPAKAINNKSLGIIQPGSTPGFVVLDKDLKIITTID